MLKFNTLLAAAGLDLAGVRLVRHRDPKYNRAIYDDAIRRHSRFEQYQSGQGNPRVASLLQSAQVLATFVVDLRGQTVFVGLWCVQGFKDGYVPDPYRAPDLAPKGSPVIFDLVRMTELDEYSGRVIVDWGGGERAWVQYAQRQDKPILELRREAVEEPFPSFARFGCRLDEIDGLPSTWLEPLRATRGVYLLVERESGAQYVGSATGADGLIGRWRHYANGHGGNVGMRELSRSAEDYDVRILETVGSSSEAEDVYVIETKKLAEEVSRFPQRIAEAKSAVRKELKEQFEKELKEHLAAERHDVADELNMFTKALADEQGLDAKRLYAEPYVDTVERARCGVVSKHVVTYHRGGHSNEHRISGRFGVRLVNYSKTAVTLQAIKNVSVTLRWDNGASCEYPLSDAMPIQYKGRVEGAQVPTQGFHVHDFVLSPAHTVYGPPSTSAQFASIAVSGALVIKGATPADQPRDLPFTGDVPIPFEIGYTPLIQRAVDRLRQRLAENSIVLVDADVGCGREGWGWSLRIGPHVPVVLNMGPDVDLEEVCGKEATGKIVIAATAAIAPAWAKTEIKAANE